MPTLPTDGSAGRFAEMRYMAPLYQRLAHRPELIQMLERECGLRRVPATDRSVMGAAALACKAELLQVHGEHHTSAWVAAAADIGAGEGLPYYLRSHRTLREALFEMVRIQPLWLPDGRLALDLTGDTLQVSIRPAADPIAATQLAWWEGVLAWMLRVLRDCVGEPLRVSEVRVMTPDSPAPEQLAACLGYPVAFGAADFGFALDVAALDHRLPGGNDRIRRAMQVSIYLSAQQCLAPGTSHLGILSWLRSLDNLSGVSIDDAAQALESTGPLLRKQLASEGTRFSDLLRAFRRERAFERLVLQGVRAESCAMSLGYVSRAALERAFKTWFFETPAQMRRHVLLLAGPYGNQDWCSPARLSRHLPARSLPLDQNPVLQAYLVGLANKAWYGGRHVKEPRTAMTEVLGAKLAHNLAIAVGAQATREASETARRWWHRTRRQAALVQQWAEMLGMPVSQPTQLVQVAGWYEIGLLPLLLQYPKAATFSDGEGSGLPRHEILARERNLIGIDRHRAGALLLSAWTLPPEAIAAVRSGHAPQTPFEWLLAASAECVHAGSPGQASAAQLTAVHEQLRAAGLQTRHRDLCLQQWAGLAAD